MRVARKTKPYDDGGRPRALRRKELLSLAGSLPVEDAKVLRAAIKAIRKNWR